MEIPRTLIDVKNLKNNADSDYQVVADGQSSIFSEVANNNDARLLSIDFTKGTQNIEIAGNQMPIESITGGKIIQVATTILEKMLQQRRKEIKQLLSRQRTTISGN